MINKTMKKYYITLSGNGMSVTGKLDNLRDKIKSDETMTIVSMSSNPKMYTQYNSISIAADDTLHVLIDLETHKKFDKFNL